jgi:hypothetical protein
MPDRDPWGDKHQGKQQEDAGHREGHCVPRKIPEAVLFRTRAVKRRHQLL